VVLYPPSPPGRPMEQFKNCVGAVGRVLGGRFK